MKAWHCGCLLLGLLALSGCTHLKPPSQDERIPARETPRSESREYPLAQALASILQAAFGSR
jgi:hypothetical protein